MTGFQLPLLLAYSHPTLLLLQASCLLNICRPELVGYVHYAALSLLLLLLLALRQDALHIINSR